MSITTTQNCLKRARQAANSAEKLGLLTTAQESLKKAIKAARDEALEEASGQETLPLGVERR